ncbi:MAG TPA: hypothetical protein VKA25_09490 [Gemmatimonadales bacterium]|nr:hypothetical protein [Gemmatimonadales bacterium]
MQERTAERCLLIQAALFHARGVIPIPDELFDTAPRQLSDEENSPERLHNLVYALATGRLKAAGKLSLQKDPFFGNFEPLVQYDTPIPELCWKWPAIHWNQSLLMVEGLSVLSLREIKYIVPDPATAKSLNIMLPELESTLHEGSTNSRFERITVSIPELQQTSAGSSGGEPGPGLSRINQERPRGRPPKFSWEEFYAEIAVRADLDGLPPTQADLTRAMSEWCLKHWGEEPSESLLKEKIAPIYRHPRKAGK